MSDYMLTTTDNPYSPFDEWDEWYAFDRKKGYHTPGLLARVAMVSEELSEVDKELTYDLAAEEILKENVTGLYKKFFQTSKVQTEE